MSRRNPLSRQDIEEYNRQLQQELDDFELQLIGEELDIAQEEIMDVDINDPMLSLIGQEFDVMSEELKLLEDQEEEVLFVPSERTRGQRRRRGERKIRERKERRVIRTIKFNVDTALGYNVYQVYQKVKGLLGQRIRIKTMDIDTIITLPNDNTKAMTLLHEIFIIDSEDDRFDAWTDKNGEEIIPVEISVLASVAGKRADQKFAEGIQHCLFQGIKDWAVKRMADCKGKARLRKWITTINNIDKYIERFKEGIPEENIQEVCNKLQINITIVLPLLDKNLIECHSKKKALKTFKYVNSKINHVEHYLFRTDKIDYIETGEEMQKIYDSIKNYKVWTKNKYDYTSILTPTKKYVLNSNYMDIINDFEQKTGLNNVKICDIKDMRLSMFVRQAVHYNNMINMNEDLNSNDEEITHIDMEKAYANFHKCRWYQGFCGKITDFRKTDRVVGIGLYRITNISFDNCHDMVKQYFVEKEVLDVYVNMNVYPSVELMFLRDMGVEFDIVEGCWGERMHFTIPKEMYEKDSRGIRHYCRYFGSCNSQRLTKNLWMRGNKDFFKNIKSYDGVHKVFFDDINNEGYIEYTKPSNRHSSQITAFITSYQRMSVFEQLLEYDCEDVIRIHTDAIFATKTAEIKNVFRYQEKEIKKLIGADKYLTGIEKGLLSLAEAENREEYIGLGEDDLNIEYHRGAGGTGKSHTNLTDKGFIKVLYASPTLKLCAEKKNKYGSDVITHARLLMNDPEQIGFVLRNYNVIMFDEITMRSRAEIEKIIKNYSMCKLIFCGDVGYQLPCIEGEQIDEEFMLDNCSIVKDYVKNYRIQDEKLLRLCEKVRELIDEKKHRMFIIREIKDRIMDRQLITINDLKSLYNIEDMVLTSINKRKDEITKLFKGKFEKEKYYIKDNNNPEYNTADIVISDGKVKSGRVQHAFTVHSIQGETCETRLFIDLYRTRSSQMIYTALSRARKMNQIYLMR